MIKIPLSLVRWTQSISIGNNQDGKSLLPDVERGRLVWYLGHGVLIEQRGRRDILVPIGQVLQMEADESVSVEQWAGAPRMGPPPGPPEEAQPMPPDEIAKVVKNTTAHHGQSEPQAMATAADGVPRNFLGQDASGNTPPARNKPGPKPKPKPRA